MKAVNLLPNDQRGAAKTPSPAKTIKGPAGSAFGAYAVLGVLAMAVVAVAAMVLTGNTISARKAELARTQADAASVAQRATSLKPYADFKQLAEARVQTVQSLATSRFDWERTLSDLSRALPREVRLSSLKGTATGASASTPVPGTAAVATASPTIDLSGCTTDQTAVARLMSRLRAVRGVTRVALKSSAKSGSSGGAVAGASDGSSLCGKGAKPSFSVTVYFERFGVPAINTPTGSAAAAAAPAASATPAPGATAAATPGTTTPASTTGTSPTTPASSTSTTQGVKAP